MPKRSPSQHVPKDMQGRFDEITKLTDAFCQTSLNDEYGQLCRELTATLCRKRPSPLVRGKARESLLSLGRPAELCRFRSLNGGIYTMVDKNPLIWMLEVNGFIIDVRHAPREIQEEAFRQSLIPYIPDA